MNNFFKATLTASSLVLVFGATMPVAQAASMLDDHNEMRQLRSKQKSDVLARAVIGSAQAARKAAPIPDFILVANDQCSDAVTQGDDVMC